MQANYRHLSQLAAMGAVLVVGLALSGCSMIPGFDASQSNQSSDGNRSSENPRKSDRENPDSKESAESAQQSAFDMFVGDCWNDPDDMSEISDLEVVPCTTAHDNEVFALLDLEDGAYPGENEIETIALSKCEVFFEDYVGTSYLESSLEIFPLYPTIGSWNNLDDREIVCSAYNMSLAPLSVTVKGSGL